MKISCFVSCLALFGSALFLRAQDAASTPFHSSSTSGVEATPPTPSVAPVAPPTPAPVASTPAPTPAPPPSTPQPAKTETVTPRVSATPAPARSVAPAAARTATPRPRREITEENADENSSAGGVVKALEKEWEASIAAHDPSVIERLVADDFVGVSSSGRIGDKVALIYESKRDKNTYKTAAARQMSVRTFGAHVAVVLGITHETGTDSGGRAFDHTFRFVDTWMERSGKWQCVAAHAAAAGRR